MSLVKWEEPKPCALSKPRFVRVPIRDAEGNVIVPVTYRFKRISRAACASGEAAITTVSVDGTRYHLCPSCGPADLREWIGAVASSVTLPPAMADVMAQDGDLILVRKGWDTAKLGRALAARGYRMRPRLRTIKRDGCEPSRVEVWAR